MSVPDFNTWLRQESHTTGRKVWRDSAANIATHYGLGCYARSGGTSSSPFEAEVTFGAIWRARPDKHRFAIVRQLVLANEGSGIASHRVYRVDDKWLCWDLYDEGLIDRARRIAFSFRPPIPIRTNTSESALVMWAVHRG